MATYKRRKKAGGLKVSKTVSKSKSKPKSVRAKKSVTSRRKTMRKGRPKRR
jgi:hypothetical protein